MATETLTRPSKPVEREEDVLAASPPFWTLTPDDLGKRTGSSLAGLSATEAAERLRAHGENSDQASIRTGLLKAIGLRLLEPLSLILLAAGAVSAATGDAVGGSIIILILGVSIGLDTLQEGSAVRAADVLRRSVALRAEVKRDGAYVQIPVGSVVVGDVIRVRAGDIVPADALISESTAFTANEAALTGEAFPSEKRPGVVTGLTAGEATNAIFRGSVAQTGEAIALVAGTGRATLFGGAASVLGEAEQATPFQRDLRAYGLLTAKLTIALVVVVLSAHMLLGRPVLQSLLFAVALAVGLTPELLPMITTVTLSRGAARMAKRKVIVKRLSSIHDLGAMTVLCTDKTGTLTSAEIVLARSISATGVEDARAATLGAIAASLGGDRGALDAALVAANPDAATGWTLQSHHVFDFNRRMGSVLATGHEGAILITKGAPEAVLLRCVASRLGETTTPMDDAAHAKVQESVRALAEQGLRTIAIASRPWVGATHDVTVDDEYGLIFEGLCAFADPPRATAAKAISRLAAAGVRLKILSGDDPVVVQWLAHLVGLKATHILSGSEIAALSDDALAVRVRSVDIYGRLAPDQK